MISVVKLYIHRHFGSGRVILLVWVVGFLKNYGETLGKEEKVRKVTRTLIHHM